MIVEMLCLLLAPRDGGSLLFTLCVLNRICSGLSEACASGADEALAYDSLPVNERTSSWDKLLARAMRWRSIGYVIAMILGGLIYNSAPLNSILPADLKLSENTAHRLPLRMVEPPRVVRQGPKNKLSDAFKLTLQTARWVFTNPKTLVVVVVGTAIDSIVRNFATINSSYYRLIDLPEWTFGFIGAALGLLGWFVPSFAVRLNQRFGTLASLSIVSGVAWIGLAGLIPAWPIYGILPAMILMTTLGFLGFTVSRALHAETDSARRATVLSVKGLAFNLGYGLFSFGFSRLLASLPAEPRTAALLGALFWQVPAFALVMVVLLSWGKILLKRTA